MRKEDRNSLSLVLGIILTLIGLSGTVFMLSNLTIIIIVPILSLIVGAILAILGGLGKW